MPDNTPDQVITATKTFVPDTSHKEPTDRIFIILLGTTIFFALVAIAESRWSPNDGQTFQLICGLTTGFGGACLGRVKPAGGSAATTTTTKSSA